MHLAAAYGLTPQQSGELTLREVAVMLSGASEREKRRWQHTTMIVTGLINYGGMRGQGFKQKPLNWLYEQMFGKASTRHMSGDAIARTLSSVATKKGPRISDKVIPRG